MGATTSTESIGLGRALFIDAVRRGDAAAAASSYTSNAHLLAPAARPVVGREDIRAFWQAGMDAGVSDVSLQAEDVGQNDGIAYETGVYSFWVSSGDGGHVMERGHYVQVLECQTDGIWQTKVEIFSPGGAEESTPMNPAQPARP